MILIIDFNYLKFLSKLGGECFLQYFLKKLISYNQNT